MDTDNNIGNTNTTGGRGYLNEGYHYFHLRDSAGQELDFHYHDFDKIVILLEGHVDYLVENCSYPLAPGSVLLVNRRAIHKAIIDRTVPYERIIIYLNRKWISETLPTHPLEGCFIRSDPEGGALFLPDHVSRSELAGILRKIEAAKADSRFGADTMSDIYLLQLMVYINRLSLQGTESAVSTPLWRDEKIADTVCYIEANLSEDLSVDTLASRVFLSRYHFMRLFSSQTGSTVHSFVREKRLLNAARLIREGHQPGAAAEESGFNDYSTFCRAFKACFGIKPSDII